MKKFYLSIIAALFLLTTIVFCSCKTIENNIYEKYLEPSYEYSTEEIELIISTEEPIIYTSEAETISELVYHEPVEFYYVKTITNNGGIFLRSTLNNESTDNIVKYEDTENYYLCIGEWYLNDELIWYEVINDSRQAYIYYTDAEETYYDQSENEYYLYNRSLKFIIPDEWLNVDVERLSSQERDQLNFYYNNILIGSLIVADSDYEAFQTDGDSGSGCLFKYNLPTELNSTKITFGFYHNNLSRQYMCWKNYGTLPIYDRYGNAVTDENIIDDVIYFTTGLHITGSIYNYDQFDDSYINRYKRTVFDNVYFIYNNIEYQMIDYSYTALYFNNFGKYDTSKVITNATVYYDVARNITIGELPENTKITLYGYITSWSVDPNKSGYDRNIWTKYYYTEYGYICENDIKW